MSAGATGGARTRSDGPSSLHTVSDMNFTPTAEGTRQVHFTPAPLVRRSRCACPCAACCVSAFP
eukprot:5245360-Prymnesium_polylepis.1